MRPLPRDGSVESRWTSCVAARGPPCPRFSAASTPSPTGALSNRTPVTSCAPICSLLFRLPALAHLAGSPLALPANSTETFRAALAVPLGRFLHADAEVSWARARPPLLTLSLTRATAAATYRGLFVSDRYTHIASHTISGAVIYSARDHAILARRDTALGRATVRGRVCIDRDTVPMRDALLECLADVRVHIGDTVVETDSDGNFFFADAAPMAPIVLFVDQASLPPNLLAQGRGIGHSVCRERGSRRASRERARPEAARLMRWA